MRHFYLSIVLLFGILGFSQHQPGGVTNAEVWYQADWDDIGNGVFPNTSETDIIINNCKVGRYKKSLLNFNHSIFTKNLCLNYTAPLENSTGRNAFFVGEPSSNKSSYSHIGTLWRGDLANLALTDSIVRNFFDFNTKSLYAREILDTYSSDKNAQVNFYHSNHYNIDRKFKSYGEEGETEFFIGQLTDIDSDIDYPDNNFSGYFPEFISFPRELSDNERHRVESYLGLKYALTLNSEKSYISSKNIVFWDESNNILFPNRIFGFGKDDISGLNQLQAESTHLKNHLVSAIGEILSTNPEKQLETFINNEHFLVYGDNGEEAELREEENAKRVRIWKKVWLAQRTGRNIDRYDTHFKLYLTSELINHLNNNPNDRIWLLQDKLIGNDVVSTFDASHIVYYPGEVNSSNNTAYFREVYFDTDQSIYDQYTFGVGPQMIVQATFTGCYKERLQIHLNIYGGEPTYNIEVEYPDGGFQAETNDNTYSFSGQAGVTYTIFVTDAQGLTSELQITPEPWNFFVNLGNTQFLNASQPQITLDAGQNIPDPNATYQWFQNGVLLPDTTSTLTVDEPGNYQVIVTSADESCSVSDSVDVILEDMSVVLTTTQECGLNYNTIDIVVDGGIGPFVTTLTDTNGANINYPHNATTTLLNVPYGTYTATTVDSMGNSVQNTIVLNPAPPINLDIYAQFAQACSTCSIEYNHPTPFDLYPHFVTNNPNFNSFTIDFSGVTNNPNIIYDWYLNGTLHASNTPSMTFSPGTLCYGGNGTLIPVITIVATDTLYNCSESQSIYTRGFCPDAARPSDPVTASESSSYTDEFDSLGLTTKVYPNPTKANTTFTYEAISKVPFSGTVEVFTVTGARLYSVELDGNQRMYNIPFKLDSAGIYLIKTVSSLGIVTTDRIIIN